MNRTVLATIAVCSLTASSLAAADPTAEVKPVLMVIADQDFYYQEYGDTRVSLEAQGLEVIVAATTTEVARPHGNASHVEPDISLRDVNPEDYSGVVFIGGYGAAQYQYAYEGSYVNAAYRGDRPVKELVNELIKAFIDEDKVVAAVCYGVSVLAWARVDGQSPIAGRAVAAWAGGHPAHWTADDHYHDTAARALREDIALNGGKSLLSGALGDPMTTSDDVYIDGNIITAENYDSARMFGEAIGSDLIARNIQRGR
jgi:putative intracellular protease/amidase